MNTNPFANIPGGYPITALEAAGAREKVVSRIVRRELDKQGFRQLFWPHFKDRGPSTWVQPYLPDDWIVTASPAVIFAARKGK